MTYRSALSQKEHTQTVVAAETDWLNSLSSSVHHKRMLTSCWEDTALNVWTLTADCKNIISIILLVCDVLLF